MRQKAIIGICAILMLIFPMGIRSVRAQYSITAACGIDVTPALRELAWRTFPKKYYSGITVGIFHQNDEMCGGPEKMFNVLIVLKGVKGGVTENYWGIYHVHFDAGGHLLSAAEYTPWQPFYSESLTPAQNDWCVFIQAVYPKEGQNQGCYGQSGNAE